MKMKLLFFFLTAAAYPLLIGLVALIIRLMDFSTGTDAAGAGMARGFAFIYSSFFISIVWFILSTVLLQVYLRAWWIGLLAPVTVAVIVQAVGFCQGYIRDNVPHSYTEYDADGKVSETGKKLRFQKHGKITEYRSDGTVQSVETYRHGEPDGPCEFFYPDGKVMAKGREKGYDRELTGIPDGTWTYYCEDGSLDDRRTYEKGELLSSGKYLYYCDSAGLICTIADRRPFTGRLDKAGIIKQAAFPNLYTTQVKDGVCDGEYCEYYAIGGHLIVAKTANHIDGKSEGVVKTYYPNGQLRSDGFYVGGAVEGRYTTYYADSVAVRPHGNIEYCCDYLDDKRHGTARWYDEDGSLSLVEENEYIGDDLEGTKTRYDSWGKPLSMYTYRNGRKEGPFYERYSDGSYAKGRYTNDVQVYNEQYRSDGSLRSVSEWKDDGWVCCPKRDYDENGELIK